MIIMIIMMMMMRISAWDIIALHVRYEIIVQKCIGCTNKRSSLLENNVYLQRVQRRLHMRVDCASTELRMNDTKCGYWNIQTCTWVIHSRSD